MIKRLSMMLLLAFAVAAAGNADAKPKHKLPTLAPVPVVLPVPVPATPTIRVETGGRVVVETEGKTVVFQPSGGFVTVEAYDENLVPISRAILDPNLGSLPEVIDIDWAALTAAVSPTLACGQVGVPMATIDFGGHSDPSMSCGMAMIALTAATVILGASCNGPLAVTGACADAIVSYLAALDNYYTSCTYYMER